MNLGQLIVLNGFTTDASEPGVERLAISQPECLDVLLREPAPQGIALDWKIPGQG